MVTGTFDNHKFLVLQMVLLSYVLPNKQIDTKWPKVKYKHIFTCSANQVPETAT